MDSPTLAPKKANTALYTDQLHLSHTDLYLG